MSPLLVGCNTGCSTACETVQNDISRIGEYLNQSTNQEFRLFGWMVALPVTFFTNPVIQNVFHFGLPKEIEDFGSLEFPSIVDKPYTDFMTASETVFLEMRLRIGFVENDGITEGKHSSSFQFIGNPA